jgi:hypothetical protein
MQAGVQCAVSRVFLPRGLLVQCGERGGAATASLRATNDSMMRVLLLGLLQTARMPASVLPHESLMDPANIGCPLAPSSVLLPVDRRRQRQRLRIGTYNVEWLFDGVDDHERVPWGSEAEAGRHMRAIAAEIERVDADILAVVELEGCFMLHRLMHELERRRLSDVGSIGSSSHGGGGGREGEGGGVYLPLVLPGTDSATRQQLGLLSRLSPSAPLQRSSNRSTYPILGSKCSYQHRAGSKPKSSGVSKHLAAVFAVEGLPHGHEELLVVAAHLKARPNEPRSCAQREAQASVLAQLVRSEGLERSPPRLVVLLGDLNDFDASSVHATASALARLLETDGWLAD